MNDLEKKSIECIKNMPIEETTYQVARNVVLDYITNLQQENNNLKTSLDESQEVVIDLQQENEELNQDLSYYQRYGADMLNKNNILEERIEKAVEYLKDNACYTDENVFVSDLRYDDCEELLNILNGRSDE